MLYIVWGITSDKDYGPAYPLRCPRCDNDVYYRLFRVRKWALLLFIIPFPYSSKYYLQCPVCGAGTKLSRKGRKRVRKHVDSTEQFIEGQMSEHEYLHLLNELDRELEEVNDDYK